MGGNVDYTINDTPEILRVGSDNLGLSYRRLEFEDDREFVSFIKGCVRQIRGSLEYKQLISYMKLELGLSRCAVLNKVTIAEVVIELHHHCLTMYDIVETIINFLVAKGMPFNSFLVAYMVMQEHYEGKVGLIPLSSTVHELVHNDSLFVHKDLVVGNHQLFYQDYSPYMSKIVKEKYTMWIEMSNNKPNEKIGIPLLSDGRLREELINKVTELNVKIEQYDINNSIGDLT